jgi:hypothetical protein
MFVTLAIKLLRLCTLIFSVLPIAANADWWHPSLHTSWQIQLKGKIKTSFQADMYIIDLFDAPQSVIDALHARGTRVVCYFSGGTWEDWRSDAESFPAEIIGQSLADWPGESWLDIRRIDVLAKVLGPRLDLAVAKGCDGVDVDNVDGYTHDETGFPLTAADQIAFNTWIANEAHARGLAVGLKNDLKQVAELAPHFDFAVNERCIQLRECDWLTPFIVAGKPVFGIEYKGNRRRVCAQANRRDFNTLMKRRDLKAWRQACGS